MEAPWLGETPCTRGSEIKLSKWREIRQARYARLAHCIWGPPISGVSAADSDSDSGFTVAGLAPLRPIQGILLKGTAGGPARLRRGPAFGTGALIIICISEPLTPALRGPDMC